MELFFTEKLSRFKPGTYIPSNTGLLNVYTYDIHTSTLHVHINLTVGSVDIILSTELLQIYPLTTIRTWKWTKSLWQYCLLSSNPFRYSHKIHETFDWSKKRTMLKLVLTPDFLLISFGIFSFPRAENSFVCLLTKRWIILSKRKLNFSRAIFVGSWEIVWSLYSSFKGKYCRLTW